MSELDSLKETGQVEEDLFAGFDPRVREDVEGLAFLGELSETVDWCGHIFVLKTLKGEDELAAGLVAKDYLDSAASAKAWGWAQVALALVSVDGREDFCPPAGPDHLAFAHARFRYLTKNWYWPTCEALYASFTMLRDRQVEAMQRVDFLSRSGPGSSSSSVASLIARDDSEAMGSGGSVPYRIDS